MLLIIEDNAAMSRALSALLQRHYADARLLHAVDGATALALSEEHRPGVVLFSIGLTDARTRNLLPRLRAMTPAAAIVVVSYEPPSLYRSWSLAVGADAFVEKDRVSQDLVPAIESARVRHAGESAR